MKTLLAVILAGITSGIVFLLSPDKEGNPEGLSKRDVEEILEDNILIFQQPQGV